MSLCVDVLLFISCQVLEGVCEFSSWTHFSPLSCPANSTISTSYVIAVSFFFGLIYATCVMANIE